MTWLCPGTTCALDAYQNAVWMRFATAEARSDLIAQLERGHTRCVVVADATPSVEYRANLRARRMRAVRLARTLRARAIWMRKRQREREAELAAALGANAAAEYAAEHPENPKGEPLPGTAPSGWVDLEWKGLTSKGRT